MAIVNNAVGLRPKTRERMLSAASIPTYKRLSGTAPQRTIAHATFWGIDMSQLVSKRVRVGADSPGVRVRRQLICGLFLFVAACSKGTPESDDRAGYTPHPKEPWSSDHYASTRLVLERTDGGFEVVSASPSFGGVTRPNVAEAVPGVLEGRQRLYEYVARNSAGHAVARGYFTVSLKARAAFTEADDPERVRHAEIDDPSRLVRVAIPFAPDIVTIEFQTLVPDKDRAFESWPRESAGSIRLDSAPPEPQQRREQS